MLGKGLSNHSNIYAKNQSIHTKQDQVWLIVGMKIEDCVKSNSNMITKLGSGGGVDMKINQK